jgi:hypothetical protein
LEIVEHFLGFKILPPPTSRGSFLFVTVFFAFEIL